MDTGEGLIYREFVCNDAQQMAVIQSFMLKAKEITETTQEDYVAEAVIDTYCRNAGAELTQLQKSEKVALESTPIMFSDIEKIKAKSENLENVNSECVNLLNVACCSAIQNKDAGLEVVSSNCLFGEYDYLSSEERGFSYYYFRIFSSVVSSIFTLGFLPLGIQIKAWTD